MRKELFCCDHFTYKKYLDLVLLYRLCMWGHALHYIATVTLHCIVTMLSTKEKRAAVPRHTAEINLKELETYNIKHGVLKQCLLVHAQKYLQYV